MKYSTWPTIWNGANYYPFGMVMPGRSWSAASAEGYRFGFNGEEKDNDIYGDGNVYDYGFRIYNPRLGKFLSLDPMFKVFPMYSPFHFANNSPIFAIDLDGLESKISIYGAGKENGDEAQFKRESAQNVEDKIVTSSEPVFTTVDFLRVLEEQTKAEGSIGLLIVNSHSQYNGVIFDNGGYSREALTDKGSYKNYSGSITINDIKTNNKIIFEEDALVVFAGCNTASPYKNENPSLGIKPRTDPVTPFAETFTKETGFASIGADGFTSPRGLGGIRMADYSFYLFQLQEDGSINKTSIGNALTPEIIERVQERISKPVYNIESIKVSKISTSTSEPELKKPANKK